MKTNIAGKTTALAILAALAMPLVASARPPGPSPHQRPPPHHGPPPQACWAPRPRPHHRPPGMVTFWAPPPPPPMVYYGGWCPPPPPPPPPVYFYPSRPGVHVVFTF